MRRYTYRELRAARGTRPSAGELLRAGYVISKIRERHGGWFDFVRAEGDLEDLELAALDRAGDFLHDLEVTEMTRSFKMITLEVLLDAEALIEGMAVDELARRARARLLRSPELAADIASNSILATGGHGSPIGARTPLRPGPR